jgi:hypothetical protein
MKFKNSWDNISAGSHGLEKFPLEMLKISCNVPKSAGENDEYDGGDEWNGSSMEG